MRGAPAAIRIAFGAFDEIEAFELRKLAADGGVVAPHLIGELGDAQRTLQAQSHQQRKQRAVEIDFGLAQERLVALGTVQEAQEIQKSPGEPVDIACIVHLYETSGRSYIACMIHASKVLVIIGSTRPRRICPQIAEWVAAIGRETVQATFERVDLKDYPLPMDDEPGIPAAGIDYAFEHTRAWSRKIAQGDAFVFVTPQYNWGYPAPLKNALDHLYKEWSGKPAMIVTYGGHSGDKCAKQLRQVLHGLHMKPIRTMPGLKLSRDHIEANAGMIDPGTEFARYVRTLKRAFKKLDATLPRG